jgi:hypothetical protein
MVIRASSRLISSKYHLSDSADRGSAGRDPLVCYTDRWLRKRLNFTRPD